MKNYDTGFNVPQSVREALESKFFTLNEDGIKRLTHVLGIGAIDDLGPNFLDEPFVRWAECLEPSSAYATTALKFVNQLLQGLALSGTTGKFSES